MLKISVCIITLNESHSIGGCLKSVNWCDEVIVVDSGSVDQTVEICKMMGCKVFYNKFVCFSSQRQFASDQAKNDWVLFIDADERLSPSAIEELKSLNESAVDGYAAFTMKFKTFLYGKLMHSCGLKNEKHVRLYNRKHAKFSYRSVHEKLVTEGAVGLLENYIFHYTYTDLNDHIEKLNRYAEMWSNDKLLKQERTTAFKVIIQFPFKFIQFYFIKGGIIDGFSGFLYSFFYGVYGTMKYAKLYQKQRQC